MCLATDIGNLVKIRHNEKKKAAYTNMNSKKLLPQRLFDKNQVHRPPLAPPKRRTST